MDYKIKYISNPDGVDLKTFVPPVKDQFCLEIEIDVQFGKDDDKWETYSLGVASPKGLRSYYARLLKGLGKLSEPKITFIESTIVMEEYNYDAMLKFLLDYLYEIKGRNQIEQCFILSRNLYWQSVEENPKLYRALFDRLKSRK